MPATSGRPVGPKPAKARPQPGKKSTGTGQSQTAQKTFQFALADRGNADDCASPRLLPAPDGAFASFLGGTLMPPTEETLGRFCTEGPKLEFGGPMARDTGGETKIPLRQFAMRLQSAIAQAATLLLDRLKTLKSCDSNGFNALQSQELLLLSQGVQAASYYLQKWAACLDSSSMPPFKPPAATTTEEALAMMNVSLPRLIVASSSLQAGLQALIPRVELPEGPEDPTEEELELQLEAEAKAKEEAEAKAAEKLRGRGIPPEMLFHVVPHLEQLIYQASCVINSLRSRSSKAPPASRSSDAAVLEMSSSVFGAEDPDLAKALTA
eukprot:TRINITY_DN66779_c0_g1_i1.p1 TRINITY_DN66779_c0_g1~~TRINITY_DN66779_c0_g1_i1.p1  ORF type:complete len:340 (-),score=83.25 TRINITY_DN66779_c0_g1_i1:39-1010(-)